MGGASLVCVGDVDWDNRFHLAPRKVWETAKMHVETLLTLTKCLELLQPTGALSRWVVALRSQKGELTFPESQRESSRPRQDRAQRRTQRHFLSVLLCCSKARILPLSFPVASLTSRGDRRSERWEDHAVLVPLEAERVSFLVLERPKPAGASAPSTEVPVRTSQTLPIRKDQPCPETDKQETRRGDFEPLS